MDELPPLPMAMHCIAPYPESNLSWFWVYDKSGGQMEQSIPVFTADQMRAYAAAAVAREPETVRVLREALEKVLPCVVTQEVACNGMKCREAVCMSCFGNSESNAQLACDAYAFASAALEKTK